VTVTLVRIDGCADHMNNVPDLIVEKYKLINKKIPFPKFLIPLCKYTLFYYLSLLGRGNNLNLTKAQFSISERTP